MLYEARPTIYRAHTGQEPETIRGGGSECQNRLNYPPILIGEEFFSLFVATGKVEGILPASGKAPFDLGQLHHPQISANSIMAAEIRFSSGSALLAALLARTQCD
jgi:hypothetical protein